MDISGWWKSVVDWFTGWMQKWGQVPKPTPIPIPIPIPIPDPLPTPDPTPDPSPEPNPDTMKDEIPFEECSLDIAPGDVKEWPIVDTLEIGSRGGVLILNEMDVNRWPNTDGDNGTNGNVWCFLYDGKWIGCPCEWTRQGGRDREWECLSAFGNRPRSGETIGIMCSTKGRHREVWYEKKTSTDPDRFSYNKRGDGRKLAERTRIKKVVFP